MNINLHVKVIANFVLNVITTRRPVFAQNLYFVGMTYTSATFASATANILPAITFIFALLFR